MLPSDSKQIMNSRNGLNQDIKDLLRRIPTGQTVLSPLAFARQQGKQTVSEKTLDFSIMFFSGSAYPRPHQGLYDLVRRASVEAERLGFQGIWLPERHFHSFGGAYPTPAVLAALIAERTEKIRIRAGSITLPLNSPIRVTETWAMLDHLSQGRVDLGFGNGWSPTDFVLAPEAFQDRKNILKERIDLVRRLWRGEAVSFVNGEGHLTDIHSLPEPIQKEPPIWIAATGNPDTFAWAGSQGFNILTMLLGGTLKDTAERVQVYRAAREAAGLDPLQGRVALMLHTLVHPDEARVQEATEAPFTRYVRDALDAQRGASPEGRALDEQQQAMMVRYAVERYRRTAALFGSPDQCLPLLKDLVEAGINEVASLIDFGPEDDLVVEGLRHLATLRDTWNGMASARAKAKDPGHRMEKARSDATIAIIGMSVNLPGAADIDALATTLADNQSALTPPPKKRQETPMPALKVGGFIEDVEWFDPEPFQISPAEAAVMDPHHRLLLVQARKALADAGFNLASVAGQRIGVFVSLYSESFATRCVAAGEAAVDPLSATGRIHALAANRISYHFNLTGPSEVIATACSSGLVAVHRAMGALRSGECDMALVAAASLLLSDEESKALTAIGLLSPDGLARPFDGSAHGQARGEGICAFLLMPLEAALSHRQGIHALIRGSATNHNGAASGSLLLPNANRQADCMAEALNDAGVSLEALGYIEAHGAGGPGDHAELAAFAEIYRRQGPLRQGVTIALASGKAAIGSLDAAGGLAGLARAVIAVRDGLIPALAAGGELSAGHPLEGTPFQLNRHPTPWPGYLPRCAGVHAYGLGGVNAHVIVENAPCDPPVPLPLPQDRPLLFPLPSKVSSDTASADSIDSVVGQFYDYVTREAHDGFDETYLTLAPFQEPVEGFSWTQTMQDPASHPLHAQLLLEKQREMRRVAFAPIPMHQVRRAMDIGCGLGTDLIVLARQNPLLEGVGYTLSGEQARQANGRIAACGLSQRLKVVQRDSSNTPFEGRFDLIFGFEVFHHIQNKEGLLSQVSKALLPGGGLILADTLAGTRAPVNLPEIGSYTLPKDDYARLFARYGLEICACVDLSMEIANFLVDPKLETMLQKEAQVATDLGRDQDFELAAAVQRSWDAFGDALREGLMLYVLIHARPAKPGAPVLDLNLSMLEAS